MPHGQTFHALEELFPGFERDDFTLQTDIVCHGGMANQGDIIAFDYNGEARIGELLMTVGIANEMLYSFVSLWDVSTPPSTDPTCMKLDVRDNPVKINTSEIGSVLTCAVMGTTAMALIPYEFR